MMPNWSIGVAPLRHLSLAMAIAVSTVPARADTPTCDLSAPSILVEQTTRLSEKQACLYHVRIPDDAYATRSFKLLVPDSFAADPSAPRMVLDFHGFGSSKSNQRAESCWQDKAIATGFVVAYPNGTGVPTSFSAGDFCCNLAVGLPRDDVRFSKDVVQEVKTLLGDDPTLAVDPAAWHTYASGLSNGGAMAHELACEATDVFDGVASVSQTYTKRPQNSCLEPGEVPIPVLDFRATNDSVIPYDGGGSLPTLFSQDWLSAEESRLAWEAELGCNGSFDVATYADGTHCLRMRGCEADFVQCTVEGPHVAYTAAKNAGLDICDAAWEFFGEQPGSTLPQ